MTPDKNYNKEIGLLNDAHQSATSARYYLWFYLHPQYNKRKETYKEQFQKEMVILEHTINKLKQHWDLVCPPQEERIKHAHSLFLNTKSTDIDDKEQCEDACMYLHEIKVRLAWSRRKLINIMKKGEGQ